MKIIPFEGGWDDTIAKGSLLNSKLNPKYEWVNSRKDVGCERDDVCERVIGCEQADECESSFGCERRSRCE